MTETERLRGVIRILEGDIKEERDKREAALYALRTQCVEPFGDAFCHAIEKHPEGVPAGPVGIAVIAEEFGEFVKAVNDHAPAETIKEELTHLYVTCIRYLQDMDKRSCRELPVDHDNVKGNNQ